jgi:2-dehydro-3-deoxygluconokinase
LTHVIAMGECMLELAHTSEQTLQLGYAGDSSNAMIYLKRAAPRVDITYITALGDDIYSDGMIKHWQEAGINVRVDRIKGELPGLSIIQNFEEGDRFFHYWREQSAYKRLIPRMTENPFTGADYVYISGITVAATPPDYRDTLLDWVVEAKAEGAEVLFDPNYRGRLWPNPAAARNTLELFWQVADRFLGSDDDMAQLGDTDFENFATHLLSGSTKEVLIRRGPEACLIFEHGHSTSVAANPCTPADTTGAGDAFNGTYLAARISGANAEDAAKRAHKVAAEVVKHKGAIIPRHLTKS